MTGVWGTEYTGVASGPTGTQFVQWDQSSSDPMITMSQWVVNFKRLTGYTPNKLVLGALTMQALKNHPAILDRIKYTQKGIVTEDLIASLLGVEKILTSYATAATGPNIPDASAQDAAATYDFIAGSKSALLCYSPAAPSLLTPSAGYTFTWGGYLGGNSNGIRIKNFRMEPIASDRVEGEMTYDQRIVSPDMGVFLNTVVA